MQPTAQKNNAKQRKTIAIVAVIAVVAIALAAVAIIAVANKREMTQAASDTCTLNAKALATHQQNFEEAQKEAEDAAKLTVDDVADGTTLETLKDAITLAEAVENAPTCPANGNASDFTKATDDIRTYADNLRNITNELDAAAKSVIASQTSRQGAAPSSAAPAFNGAKLRFQTTLTSLKMTFATFSQPDNRPYRKSIPPFHKNPKELINGVKVTFWTTSPPHKRFRTVSGLYMADSTVRPEAFPDEIGYLQHVISHLPNPVARLRRIHHDAPSQTLQSDALYWPWAR